MLTITNLTPAPLRRKGILYPPKPDTTRQYNVEIEINTSVRLYGFISQYDSGKKCMVHAHFDLTFKIDDRAEYDAYNFSYTGEIIAIGERTITIRDDKTTRRLSLYEFAWRNCDFDAARIAQRNAETSNAI